MSHGWICVHRKLLEWEWFDDHNTFRLFMYLMLKANHQDKNWKGITIKRGQHLTSLDKMVVGSGLTKSQIRTSINKLKSTQEIAHHSNAQHTVITIINYDLYQAADTQVSTPVTHESHTNRTRIAPNNNDNNDNNEKKQNTDTASVKTNVPHQEVLDSFHEILDMLPKVQVYSDKRKAMVKGFFKKRTAEAKKDFTVENLAAYFNYIKHNCTWMLYPREDYSGSVRKPRSFDYIMSDRCYIAVKEQRHDDMGKK